MLDIKKCPCCGGPAEVIKETYLMKFAMLDIPTYRVVCADCGLSTKAFFEKDDATIAWNKRSE